MAKGFKSGGRRRGSKNRKTRLREEALAASTIDPMSFFLGVMRSNEVDQKLRLEAGKAAATYLYKKPTESAPGETARLIEGVAAPEWTAADTERLNKLGTQCWATLSPQEQSECRGLNERKLAVEIQKHRASMSPQDIEAEENERRLLGL
jgi:hypothetical protein